MFETERPTGISLSDKSRSKSLNTSSEGIEGAVVVIGGLQQSRREHRIETFRRRLWGKVHSQPGSETEPGSEPEQEHEYEHEDEHEPEHKYEDDSDP